MRAIALSILFVGFIIASGNDSAHAAALHFDIAAAGFIFIVAIVYIIFGE
jgi:hypothetical protein